MAFPTIPTAAANRLLVSSQASTTTTHTFPSLTTLAQANGDLMLAVIVTYLGTTANAEFSGWGGSFTEFVDQSANSTTIQSIGAAYKWSDGTETGTFTVTTAGTTRSVMFLMAIPGAHPSTVPQATAKANGTTAAADPVSLDPSWSAVAEDILWIAVGVNGETSLTGTFGGITAAPANFTDYLDSGIIGGDVIGALEGAVAFRQFNGTALDVGTFTLDTSAAGNSALVIAVRPITARSLLMPSGMAVGMSTAHLTRVGLTIANVAATATGFVSPAVVTQPVSNPVSITAKPAVAIGAVAPSGVSVAMATLIAAKTGITIAVSNLVAVQSVINIGATLGVSIGIAGRADVNVAIPPNQGAATGTITWAGTATGTNIHSGTATGAVSWAGTSTGTAAYQGSSTGTVTWAGTADGVAPAVGVNAGEGTGTITWAGTAQGTSTHTGSGTGAITWSGASSGVSTHSGASTGNITWAGSSTGTSTHTGSSTGTITWAGTATGESPAVGVNDGAGNGTITWAGTAAGTSTYQGSATGAVTWTGTANGITTRTGTAAGTITWAGTAAGLQPSEYFYAIGSKLGVEADISGGTGIITVEGG